MSAENVLKALESWIIRVADENTKATPEELDALPEVARVFFGQFPFTIGASHAHIEEGSLLSPGAVINLR